MPDKPRKPGAPNDFELDPEACFDPEFDARLDAALSGYSEPGNFDSQAIAQRILARVASQIPPSQETGGASPRHPWLVPWKGSAPRYQPRPTWRISVPAAALIAMLVLVASAILLTKSPWRPQSPATHNLANLHRPGPNTYDRLPPIAAATPPPAADTPAPPRKSDPRRGRYASRAAAASRTVPASNPAPRLDLFPQPSPLTPQEQALLSLAGNPHSAACQVALDQQQSLSDPVQISEIRIQPLAITELDAPQP